MVLLILPDAPHQLAPLAFIRHPGERSQASPCSNLSSEHSTANSWAMLVTTGPMGAGLKRVPGLELPFWKCHVQGRGIPYPPTPTMCLMMCPGWYQQPS